MFGRKAGEIAPEMLGLARRFSVDSAQKKALDQACRFMGVRLAQLRLEKGISQQSLARRIHVSTQLISAWESGRRSGSIHVRDLVILARFYGVSLVEMLDFSGLTSDGADREPVTGGEDDSQSLAVSRHEFCGPGSPAACSECKAIWDDAEREAV